MEASTQWTMIREPMKEQRCQRINSAPSLGGDNETGRGLGLQGFICWDRHGDSVREWTSIQKNESVLVVS